MSEHARGGWPLALQWMAINAGCGALAPALLKALETRFLAGAADRGVVGPPLVLGVTAAGLLLGGGLQWAVLRQRFPSLGWWPAATLAGAVAAWALVTALVTGRYTYRETFRSDLLVFSLLMGTIGAAQWLVLRRRSTAAGWWVPASAAGGAALWLTYSLIASTAAVGADTARGIGPAAITAVAIQGGGGLAAYATITACALVRLERRSAAGAITPLLRWVETLRPENFR